MISLVLAAALFAAAEPAAAPAEPAAAAAAKPEKAEKAKKSGLVCRNEPVVGSRMPTRTCMTQEQWDARAADGRKMLEDVQRYRPLNGQ